jgi:hypothetical protein
MGGFQFADRSPIVSVASLSQYPFPTSGQPQLIGSDKRSRCIRLGSGVLQATVPGFRMNLLLSSVVR